MTLDGRLANSRTPVVRGLYCLSSQNLMKKALYEITVNSQGQLNPFSPMIGSSVTPQRHITTLHDTQALVTKISLGRQQLIDRVTASQLEGWLFDSLTMSESPQRFLSKSIHLNCHDNKHISGVGIPLFAAAKIIKKHFLACLMLFFNVQWDLFNMYHQAVAQTLGRLISYQHYILSVEVQKQRCSILVKRLFFCMTQ